MGAEREQLPETEAAETMLQWGSVRTSVEEEVQERAALPGGRRVLCAYPVNCPQAPSASTFLHHTEQVAHHFLPRISSSQKKGQQYVFIRGMTDQCLIQRPLAELLVKEL